MSVHRYYKVTKDGEKIPTTWYCSIPYVTAEGKKAKKIQRGFQTQREAKAWEREFLAEADRSAKELEKERNLKKAGGKGYKNMTFGELVECYKKNMKNTIRENTWVTKNAIIDQKILPYFENQKLDEIKKIDILNWVNAMIDMKDSHGKPYTKVYLRTVYNQLNAIFNHAVAYYELPSNPAFGEGKPFSKKPAEEMKYWTKREYLKFADEVMDKSASFYAFEMLYWCGIRLGELLALTPSDFDFENNVLHITKSYQKIKGKELITPPKTEKSVRHVKMPKFISEEMKEYIDSLYGIKDDQRIFEMSKSYLHHEMDRGSKAAGVKRIRIHDLRHSHVSLLIHLNYSAVAIADRMGHESIYITYQYAHLFPNVQESMADVLDEERMCNDEQEEKGRKEPLEEQNDSISGITRGI